jgi:catechol 2,3-dioxygenase-like lactoylglutathione lyase family enzyme
MHGSSLTVLLLAAAFLLSRPPAQDASAAPADLGAPGPEHRVLDALVGTWEVTARIPIAPGKHVEGRAACEGEWVMDGRFVRLEYASTFAGKPLSVVRYVGFDRHKRRFVEMQLESTHTDVMQCEGALSEDGSRITCQGTHVDAATGERVGVRTETTLSGRGFTLVTTYRDKEGNDAKAITLRHEPSARTAAPMLYRVILQVADLERAAAFYEKLLSSKGRRVSADRHYFDCGPVILALVDPAVDGQQAKATPDYSYLAVRDLEAVHARAAALDCISQEQVHGAPAGAIIRRPWGERSFYALDPFGNKLCFVDAETVFTGR